MSRLWALLTSLIQPYLKIYLCLLADYESLEGQWCSFRRFPTPSLNQERAYLRLAEATRMNGIPANHSLQGLQQGLVMYSVVSYYCSSKRPQTHRLGTIHIQSLAVSILEVSSQAGSLHGNRSVDKAVCLSPSGH